jgi:phosphonate transport system permease protein
MGESVRRWGRGLTWSPGAFWPPETSGRFLGETAIACVETLAISLAGTVLGLALAGPLLFAATRTMMISGAHLWRQRVPQWRHAAHAGARAALAVFRSIPELVWGLIFVLFVGFGAVPAVLAIAVHTAGVFGKIIAELLEEVRPEPQEALVGCGASGPQVFLYGALGQAAPAVVSYVLYRWEVNIRMAAIFGFVGAGALGRLMQERLAWMRWPEVTTLVAAVFVVVLAVDLTSAWIRRRMV